MSIEFVRVFWQSHPYGWSLRWSNEQGRYTGELISSAPPNNVLCSGMINSADIADAWRLVMATLTSAATEAFAIICSLIWEYLRMTQRKDATHLLTEPKFWGAHLWQITKLQNLDDTEEDFDRALGISTDGIESLWIRELTTELEWPSFHIPLCSGFSFLVTYENWPEDHVITYRVLNSERSIDICVGNTCGHDFLPGLRWEELVCLSRVASINSIRPFSWGEVMLLVLPSVWITKAQDLKDIKQKLRLALDGLQLGPRAQTSRMADELVKNSLQDVNWRPDKQLGWVNDAPNSRRNSNGLARLTDQEFGDLKELLDLIHAN
ncbi:MAG: hypothetical protein ACJ8FY_13005 [Gemmataceae bacterium]